MDNLEHIRELTCGECPDWVCQQIAAELDKKDAEIKRLKYKPEEYVDYTRD